MNSKTIKSVVKITVIFLIFIYSIVFLGCAETELRTESNDNFDGSVHSAFQIAKPELDSLTNDEIIYYILGTEVWKNGCLQANKGSWSFICWSSTEHKRHEVIIDYAGNMSKYTINSSNPPAIGSGISWPTTWKNSKEIFQSIDEKEITADIANIVVFIRRDFEGDDLIPIGQVVWAINFAEGKTPLVVEDDPFFADTNF